MKPRERVLAAFAHEKPDRVPIWCGSSAEFWAKAKKQLGLGDEQLRVRLGGGFEPLLPAMIEAGLDAVHAIQPCCAGMDLRRLKKAYGRQIVFNGAIDSHHVLIRGTPASVRRSTRDVLRIMMPGGGYVAGASHDSILEETAVENVLAMVDTVMEAGVYGK